MTCLIIFHEAIYAPPANTLPSSCQWTLDVFPTRDRSFFELSNAYRLIARSFHLVVSSNIFNSLRWRWTLEFSPYTTAFRFQRLSTGLFGLSRATI